MSKKRRILRDGGRLKELILARLEQYYGCVF